MGDFNTKTNNRLDAWSAAFSVTLMVELEVSQANEANFRRRALSITAAVEDNQHAHSLLSPSRFTGLQANAINKGSIVMTYEGPIRCAMASRSLTWINLRRIGIITHR